MNKEIEEYKSFIDDMVSLSESAIAKWVTSNGFPKIVENEEKNSLLESLSQHQRVILARLINQAKSSGVHDVLAYLNEKQEFGEIKIVKNSLELPVEPFDTEMHFDYVARLEGDEWPKL